MSEDREGATAFLRRSRRLTSGAVRRRTRGRARASANAPIELDGAYLRAVKRLEALAQNQSGADKSWVEQALRSWRDHYTRATR